LPGERNTYTWAILGGGNGGQSAAGHLSLMGHGVRLYDIIPETVEAINSKGGIEIDGEVNGFGRIELATTDISQALIGADIVMIVTPALAHRDLARDCSPYLNDGQVVVLHPGATFGALEFRKVLDEEGCRAAVVVAETNSLIYACRSMRPGQASIFGVKHELTVAALPGQAIETVVDRLHTAYPQIQGGRSVFETSLANPNAMMHPAPTLFNTSLIESNRDWLYYWDGITPSIGAFVEEMDRERCRLGQALGQNLMPVLEWYHTAYGAKGGTLCEAVRNNPAYAGVKGQKSLLTRYILEDVPMGLTPMVSLGQKLGIQTLRMKAVVNLAELLLDRDLTTTGRTLANVGLADMTVAGIQHYVMTGERPPISGEVTSIRR
jgi:opine dehydrogenase